MKKLKLDLDSLAVDTFSTQPRAAEARGTVRGREWSPSLFYPQCNSNNLVCLTYPTGCPCTPRAGD